MSDQFTAPAWGSAPAPTVGPATPAEPPASKKRVSPWLWLSAGAAVILVAAVVAVLGFWKPGFFVSRVYDVPALQNGVLTVLRNDYRIAAEAVACPPEVPVTTGLRFSCNALVEGRQQPIEVRVLDAGGRFEVVQPA